MNKTLIGLSLAALALAGTAYARQPGPGMDPMGDKTMTRADAQNHAAMMFERMDANHDGKLDEADRAAHMGEMFDKLDTNHDGTISRDEFAAAHRGGAMGHGDGGPGMGEHRMDQGGGGGHGGAGGMGMMMMRMADTNKDNAVSKDEFVTAALKHFDMTDTDHDGKLTPAERKAAHAKMGEHRQQMRDRRGGHSQGSTTPPPAQ